MRGPLLAATLIASVCTAGCRVFDEALLDGGERDAGGRVDAGSDAGADAGVDGGMDAGAPGCPVHRPPPRPDGPDRPEAEVFTYALRDIVLDQGDDWAMYGYDLDGLCTEPPDLDIECLPPSASGTPEVDGPNGVDNVMGHEVLPLLLVAEPTLQEERRDEMERGIGVIVLQIRGWSGEDDDPRVDVTMSQSVFGTPALPDGGAPDAQVPDGGINHGAGLIPPLPEWEGRDWWWTRDDGFVGGDPDRPRVHDSEAYVSGGTVVMRIPDRAPIIFGGTRSSIAILLTDAVLTLRVSPDRQRVERAIMAGRWPIPDLLTWIEHGGICEGSADYRRIERIADLADDVRATPGTGGPGAICDALSMGFGYTGVRAGWAGVVPTLGVPNPCDLPDGGLDAGSDAGSDGGSDAGLDAGLDAGADGG